MAQETLMRLLSPFVYGTRDSKDTSRALRTEVVVLGSAGVSRSVAVSSRM